MNALADWFAGTVHNPLLLPTGWALVHSVWQLPLIAGLAGSMLSLAPRTTARTKYAVYCGGMLLMALAPLATFLFYLPSSGNVAQLMETSTTPAGRMGAPLLAGADNKTTANNMVAEESGSTAASDTVTTPEPESAVRRAGEVELRSFVPYFHRVLPWISIVWLLGVVVLSLRFVVGWLQVRQLRRMHTTVATADEQQMLQRVAARLGITQRVELLRCGLLEVPATVGWLKPLVLLPMSFATGLNASQTEAVLAHELAHIRRADYAINLLQCVIETLLFYHPAVWWISAKIRTTREHCCDDIAVQVCGDRREYASALLEMEQLRRGNALAMSAAGGSLKSRIARLAGKDSLNGSSPWGAFGMFALSIALLASCLLAPVQPVAPEPDPVVALAPVVAPADEEPDKKKENPAATKPKNSPAEKAGSSAPPEKPIRVRMKVVDAATGEPIRAVMIQAGKLPDAAGGKITWGYSETRTRSRTGDYSTSIRWHGGWTARVVADGYAPQPILTSRNAPGKGVEKLEMTLKLDRGRLLKGVVLNYLGKPMKNAAVFGVTPRHLNLAGGQAINSWDGKVDKNVSGVLTDDEGRFEMYAGAAERVAISHPDFDAWVADIPPEGNPFEVKLPQPAKITFTLNVPGADKDSAIFYQFLSHHQPRFKGVETIRTVPVKNGGKLELSALTPGRYQFWRSKELRTGNMGYGGSLDHVFLEFQPGQTQEVNIVRKTGGRLSGEIKPPGDVELSGVILTVQSLEKSTSPFNPKHEYTVKYDTRVVHADAENGFKRTFTTELLEPGQYQVKAVAYIPLTERQRFRTGIVRPTYDATTTIIVPESGELKPVTLQLKKAVY